MRTMDVTAIRHETKNLYALMFSRTPSKKAEYLMGFPDVYLPQSVLNRVKDSLGIDMPDIADFRRHPPTVPGMRVMADDEAGIPDEPFCIRREKIEIFTLEALSPAATEPEERGYHLLRFWVSGVIIDELSHWSIRQLFEKLKEFNHYPGWLPENAADVLTMDDAEAGSKDISHRYVVTHSALLEHSFYL